MNNLVPVKREAFASGSNGNAGSHTTPHKYHPKIVDNSGFSLNGSHDLVVPFAGRVTVDVQALTRCFSNTMYFNIVVNGQAKACGWTSDQEMKDVGARWVGFVQAGDTIGFEIATVGGGPAVKFEIWADSHSRWSVLLNEQ